MAFDRVIGSPFLQRRLVDFRLKSWGFIHPLQIFKQAKK